MRRVFIVTGLSLAALSAPAFAQVNARSSLGDPKEEICRRPPPLLGTRVPPRRICKTRAEWDAEARVAQGDWQSRPRPASGNDRR